MLESAQAEASPAEHRPRLVEPVGLCRTLRRASGLVALPWGQSSGAPQGQRFRRALASIIPVTPT